MMAPNARASTPNVEKSGLSVKAPARLCWHSRNSCPSTHSQLAQRVENLTNLQHVDPKHLTCIPTPALPPGRKSRSMPAREVGMQIRFFMESARGSRKPPRLRDGPPISRAL
ncbi:hypothetical protein EVAR_389_1 [Eumeta japonica]|uniref:Uncharacterized protein n=1 Tax=Eumeta variegata TaxID=151549 RepID=A0A4C1SC97_EUMVA|nr:hypothetical protein EVAR_389_1 [Eumeta japonica]